MIEEKAKRNIAIATKEGPEAPTSLCKAVCVSWIPLRLLSV